MISGKNENNMEGSPSLLSAIVGDALKRLVGTSPAARVRPVHQAGLAEGRQTSFGNSTCSEGRKRAHAETRELPYEGER